MVELADKAERELSQNEEVISGEISIGCGETQNMEKGEGIFTCCD